MPVLKERIAKIWVRCGAGTFAGGPSIVGAGKAIVDLFPRARSYVVDEHPAGTGLEAEREGISQPQRPDRSVRARGSIKKWIVSGDGPIRIEAQDLAEAIV